MSETITAASKSKSEAKKNRRRLAANEENSIGRLDVLPTSEEKTSENEGGIQQILPHFSFEEDDALEISMSNDFAAEEIDIETVPNEKKKRNKFVWVTEATYDDLEEAIEHINEKGFVLHNDSSLKCGQKFHFRCKTVPKAKRPWCDKQYSLFLPSDSVQCIVQHTNLPHNCHELMKNVKKRLSDEMKEYIKTLFEKGTQQCQSVLNHISAEKENGKFPNDELPRKRQIEYLLGEFKNEKVKPLFKLGDLIDWCNSNSVFPNKDDSVFVLAHECSALGDKMKFRFVLSTPELLNKAIQLETLCIDATYKLNWHGFPLIVLGTVDRTKRFHPLAYACVTNETTSDYEFVFESFRNAVEQYYEVKFEPKILIADGADAIRNAFYNTFPSAELDVMCFAHVIRNIRKRPFANKLNKQLILDDIRKAQLAPNRNAFVMMTQLICKKWSESEPEVVEYFKKEWLGTHCNWFEGAANYTPSTNNALESHNAVIKRTVTLRRRLPLNQFLNCMCTLLADISRQFISGERSIELEPAVKKNLLQEAALLEQNRFKAFKAKASTPTYIVPSSTCPPELAKVSYYTALTAKSWESFDTFICHGYQLFWIVEISPTAWKTESRCTCPAFFKQNICKHIVALAMRENILKYNDSFNPTLISAVHKKSGRPKNAVKALINQS